MDDIREKESIKEFDEWAYNYEKGLWNFYFKASYRSVLGLAEKYVNRDSKIFDVGCGTGELVFLLSRKATEGKIVGLDLSPKMIEVAQKNKLERNISNVEFIVSRANSTPYENECFDLVFCLNALHHVPDHPSFLKEVSRVLKNNGKFVLLDLISDNIIRKTWIWINRVIFKEKEVEYHSKRELAELLQDVGLKPEIQRSFLFFTLISISKKL